MAGQTASTVDISFSTRLFSPTIATSLALDSLQTDSIDTAGHAARHTRSRVISELLLLDGRSTASEATAILYAPSWRKGCYLYLSRDDGPFVLPESGEYTIRVAEGTAFTGDYAFRLLNSAPPAAAELPTDGASTDITLDPASLAVLEIYRGGKATASCSTLVLRRIPTGTVSSI